MNQHEKRLRKYEQQHSEKNQPDQETLDHKAVQAACDELSDDELHLLETQFNDLRDGEYDDGDYAMIEKFYDLYRQKLTANGD